MVSGIIIIQSTGFFLGRTSRVAFKNAEKFGNIVALPEDLIVDLRRMIDALSSGHDLDPDKFQELADSWVDRFHQTGMRWNWFSPYMHMLMVHGGEVINALPLAPGLLSEVGTSQLINIFEPCNVTCK